MDLHWSTEPTEGNTVSHWIGMNTVILVNQNLSVTINIFWR